MTALVVEDGSIVPGADALCSVAFADSYHAKMGNTSWADLDSGDDKEPAIRRATQYLRSFYRSRWKGYQKSATQPLDWPRSGVYTIELYTYTYGGSAYLVPNTVVPDEIKNACAELALKAVTASLSPDLTRGIVSKKIGPLETVFDRNSPQQKRYRAIDAMLSPFLNGSSGGISVPLIRS